MYTGDDKKFDGSELYLSDAFEIKEFMEVKVRVLRQEMVNENSVLGEYLCFIRLLKKNMAIYATTETAVMETIKSCKEYGILSDYLREREGEIANMIMEGINIEKLIGTAEENREEGREEGRKEGEVLMALRFASNKLKQGLADNYILDDLICSFELDEYVASAIIQKAKSEY